MNPEVFAEFLTRLGHRVVKTDSCYWYDAQPRFYFYFPYHKLITPIREELDQILLDEPSIGVRYFAPPDQYGKESYLIVCSNKNYDLTSVDANRSKHETRRRTNKGLKNFEIRQLSFKEVVEKGAKLNQDTLIRQGRAVSKKQEEKWKLYCEATIGLKGFEAWGAFQDKTLAAYLVAFHMEDHFTILHQNSATEFLPLSPNNALVYTFVKNKIVLPEVNSIFYGPQSLDAPASLDEFKFRMGFEKRPIKQAIVFNPLVRPFVNRVSHGIVRGVSKAMPKSDSLRKLEGIFRFYRESTTGVASPSTPGVLETPLLSE